MVVDVHQRDKELKLLYNRNKDEEAKFKPIDYVNKVCARNIVGEEKVFVSKALIFN